MSKMKMMYYGVEFVVLNFIWRYIEEPIKENNWYFYKKLFS